MKTILSLLVVFALLTVSEQRSVKRQAPPGGDDARKRVACYYTDWSVYRPGEAKFVPQNINPYLCTHLLYAFAGLDIDANTIKAFDKFQDLDNGGYKAFTDLRLLNPDLKTMLAVGGWNEGSERFSTIVADEYRRSTFVKNSIQFLRMYNFDGVDLVWQYPAFREGSSPQDKENFAKLVEELRIEITKESNDTGRPPLLISVAMSALSDYIDKGYDVPTLNLHVDFINLIAYDYHLSSGPFVYHHSPLYPVREEFDDPIASQLNADSSIRNIISKGMAPDKINLGIPTYGRLYMLEDPNENEPGSSAVGGGVGNTTVEPGYITYYEVCKNIMSGGWTVKYHNMTAMGPYAYKDNLWVGYDNPEFAKRKAEYAIMMGLGGIMFWTVDDDDFRGDCHGRGNPMIWAGREGLLTQVARPSSSPQPPTQAPGDGETQGTDGQASGGSVPGNDGGQDGGSLPDIDGVPAGDGTPGSDGGPGEDGTLGSDGAPGDGGVPGNDGVTEDGGVPSSDSTPVDDTIPGSDRLPGGGGLPSIDGIPGGDTNLPADRGTTGSTPVFPPRRRAPPRVSLPNLPGIQRIPTPNNANDFPIPSNFFAGLTDSLNKTDSLLSFIFPGSVFFQDIKVWVINHFHNYANSTK